MPTPTAAKSTSTRSTYPTSPARATAAHERHRRPAMTTPAHHVPPLARLTRACSTASSALGLTAGAAPYSNQIRWVIGFVAACIVLVRSEEHTSELQSLMRISYAVFCLKKKKQRNNNQSNKEQG